jgi:hypothetical protein
MNNWDVINDFAQPIDGGVNKQSDLDALYAHVFGSDEGRKVLTDLRARTIEQPSWYPGEEASHGFAREGQNSIVRNIEERIKRARTK